MAKNNKGNRITAVRGVKDILPEEIGHWRRIESVFHEVLQNYGYGEIRLPMFEETVLFQRSIGEDTDIVEKEMYTFRGTGKKSITLRPEGTASVVRAYLEHNMFRLPPPVKLYYIGPMFRHERPQKGRLRQFHQVGAEIFGIEGPEAEAELLQMLMFCLTDGLGLEDLAMEVNTLGDDRCRPAYRKALREYMSGKRDELCPNCHQRLVTNPLRVLDCKVEGCRKVAREAPVISSFLCGGCRSHFEEFKDLLDAYGVPYHVNEHLVRGLDYYTRTTYEVVSSGLGAQNAVVGGGRYDNLVAMFGGPPTPGLGFALGMERLLSLVEDRYSRDGQGSVYVAALDDQGREAARMVARDLRTAGIRTDLDYQGKSLRAQMRQAGRRKDEVVVVLGGEEMAAGKALVKNMTSGRQKEVSLGGLSSAVSALLTEISDEREEDMQR